MRTALRAASGESTKTMVTLYAQSSRSISLHKLSRLLSLSANMTRLARLGDAGGDLLGACCGDGIVMDCEHSGHGILIPAPDCETMNLPSQCGQLNVISDSSGNGVVTGFEAFGGVCGANIAIPREARR